MMVHLPTETWVAIGAVTVGAIFASLRSLAAAVRTQAAAEDLRRRVLVLRKKQSERLAGLVNSGEPPPDADMIEDEPARTAHKQAA